jgi:hypothetical protein
MITKDQLRADADRAFAGNDDLREEAHEMISNGTAPRAFRPIAEALRHAFPDRGQALTSALQHCNAAVWFDRFRTLIRSAPRRRSNVEAPVFLSAPYLEFLIGVGLARLGRSDDAISVIGAAQKTLPDDPLHACAAVSFRSRAAAPADRRSIEELAPEAYDALDAFHRYKLDRLRQGSVLLEPYCVPDAVLRFREETQGGRRLERSELTQPRDPSPTTGEATELELTSAARAIPEATGVGERLERIRALLSAARGIDHAVALRLVESVLPQLEFITDGFNANSHFCLSLISFFDPLVLVATETE